MFNAEKATVTIYIHRFGVILLKLLMLNNCQFLMAYVRNPGSDISLNLLLSFIAILICFIELLCRFIELLLRFIELLFRYIELLLR